MSDPRGPFDGSRPDPEPPWSGCGGLVLLAVVMLACALLMTNRLP